jgi:pimeloyl-ACP methyl ester carboxylesterase
MSLQNSVIFKRILVVAGLVLTACYISACAIFGAKQREMIYFPPAATPHNQAASVEWPHDGERLRISQIVRPTESAILYFGGNAEDVSYIAAQLGQAFPDESVYALHYRSYAGSTGKPSEAALVADGLALFDKISVQHKQIKVVGRSLGSGIAVQISAARPAKSLLLITPYDSLMAVAQEKLPYLPVSLILKDTYKSVNFAPKITMPVVLLAGSDDTLIPPAHAVTLLHAFTNTRAEMQVFDGVGHNDVDGACGYVFVVRAALGDGVAAVDVPNCPGNTRVYSKP